MFKDIRATVARLRELGFTIHPEKLVLVPTQHNIPRVCDRLCKNDNNSDWKQSIYTLCLNFLLNYQATIRELSANHRGDSVLIQSCSICPNVLHTGDWKNAKYIPWLDLVAILTGKFIFQRKQQMN